MFQGSYRDLTQFAFEQNEYHSLPSPNFSNTSPVRILKGSD